MNRENKMKDIFAPNQRIIMLQGMERDNDFSLSNEMLQRLLVMYGHGVGIEHVNEQIVWLKERGLVTVDELGNGVIVPRLTRSGIDVARGHSRIDGIERPIPE